MLPAVRYQQRSFRFFDVSLILLAASGLGLEELILAWQQRWMKTSLRRTSLWLRTRIGHTDRTLVETKVNVTLLYRERGAARSDGGI